MYYFASLIICSWTNIASYTQNGLLNVYSQEHLKAYLKIMNKREGFRQSTFFQFVILLFVCAIHHYICACLSYLYTVLHIFVVLINCINNFEYYRGLNEFSHIAATEIQLYYFSVY